MRSIVNLRQNAVILVAFVIGAVIGMLKGQEAKQKFIFRLVKNDMERQQISKLKEEQREGKLWLDDIEMKAFHKS